LTSARHWFLLHAVVLGWLRGAALGPGATAGSVGAGRWWWSGAVLVEGSDAFVFSCMIAPYFMRRMNE